MITKGTSTHHFGYKSMTVDQLKATVRKALNAQKRCGSGDVDTDMLDRVDRGMDELFNRGVEVGWDGRKYVFKEVPKLEKEVMA